MLAESQANVFTFTASDETDVYWSIQGGDDANLFAIDANTGSLTFKNGTLADGPIDETGNPTDVDYTLPVYVSPDAEGYTEQSNIQ